MVQLASISAQFLLAVLSRTTSRWVHDLPLLRSRALSSFTKLHPPCANITQIEQPGTYWYHSHVRGQYPDGLRGPLIIDDPDSPYKDQYDEEIILTLADWYHQMPSTLLNFFISYANPTGAEPVPDAALFNDTQNLKINIEPGKTYLFRMINMAAFAAQYLWFEGHTMRIVEVDGVYTEPAEADMIYLTAAQRYSVLITAKNDTSANFAIQGSMDQVGDIYS
jgi:iron transport multicopper oxidase